MPASTDPLPDFRPQLATGARPGAPHGAMPALPDLELALAVCGHALARWTTRAAAAAGRPGMSPLESVILQQVDAAGAPPPRLAALCLALAIEDMHQARYAVRKLVAAGLVTTGRCGKEMTLAPTPAGSRLCAELRLIRDSLLAPALRGPARGQDLAQMAQALRMLAAGYDRAGRAAAGW